MKTSLTIMLVEDNDEYRQVLRRALCRGDDMTISGEFTTAEIALQSLEAPTAVTPDIILLDLRLPGISGLEVLPDLLQTSPKSSVIVLSQSNQEKDVVRAISSGASGYLLKSSSISEIREGIEKVANGGAWLDAGVANFILKNVQSKFSGAESDLRLSDREMDILRLLADGMLKKQISDELNIAYDTVDTHIRRIYTKLDVRNAPGAVAKAFRAGLLD